MSTKGNFLLCYIFLVPFRNNSSKFKNKTQNTLIKRDTQSSKKLVLISFFLLFNERNYCIAWENPNFETVTFKRLLIAYQRTFQGNIKFGKLLRTLIRTQQQSLNLIWANLEERVLKRLTSILLSCEYFTFF